MNKKLSQHGFTLVEVAMVFVVFGMMVASILMGSSLLHTSKMRATVNQFQKFNGAVYAFRLKYRALPGDVAGGARYGFVDYDNVPINGNENGVFEDSNGNSYEDGVYPTLTGEHVFFWNHLNYFNADTVEGVFYGIESGPLDSVDVGNYLPLAKVGGHWGVYSRLDRNYYSIARVVDNSYEVEKLLKPVDARFIDEKLDDAVPDSGIVIAGGGADSTEYVSGGGVYYAPVSTGAGFSEASEACVSEDDYNVVREEPECTLHLRMPR